MELLLSLLWVVFLIGLYFLPTFIAVYRKHNNKVPIILSNLLLGWILIGWVVALIWSTTDNVKG